MMILQDYLNQMLFVMNLNFNNTLQFIVRVFGCIIFSLNTYQKDKK